MDLSQNLLLAGLIVGGVLVLLALIVGGYAQANRARMLTHQERIKALEMGQPLPDDPETARIKAKTARTTSMLNSVESPEAPKSLAYHCHATTGYISGAGFFFGFVAGVPVGYGLAAAAGAVGVTGLICGTILATREARRESSIPSRPRFDPEAV